eukprot:CAMPEP_0176424616 /NCGR_PEP_ID=MMETSP0127-20121128/10930_1 /TAXON_ID=938130 /ORGANISM="Platyophrya macrostoma, Strain WH" /LENGTH=401 /DNA_ID=CAMNT_0017805681 /DNA_START=58 /DNA_END=1263 /DNA_ORIENTATION=+
MSSAYVFYSSLKTLNTQSAKPGPYKSVIPFPNYHVFFAFADGNWSLFDCVADKTVKEGVIKGDATKQLTLFRCPRAFDEKTVIYVNASLFKLQGMNPYTGELDSQWEFDAPTFEGLPEASRTNDQQVDRALVGLDVQLLKKSKIVGVLERKENSQGFFDFLISAYQGGKKDRLLQLNHNAQGKPMKFAPGNQEDTFIFYPTTQFEGFQAYILNVNEKDKGLQSVTVNAKMECTFLNLFPWSDNSVVLFGNPDEGGTPYQVHYKIGSDNVDVVKMNCNRYSKPDILSNVLAVDPTKNRVLLKESNADHGCSVAVWNSALNKVEFAREQPNTKDAVSSYDGSYFVEFDGAFKAEKGTVKFTFNRLVSKKMFLLHFMKQAKLNDKPLIEIHGKIDVLRDVANMF